MHIDGLMQERRNSIADVLGLRLSWLSHRYLLGIFIWLLCWWFACRSWWRHEMKTFFALLVFCAENSPVPGEFSAQRPVTRSFDFFFDLHLNKQLSKQSRGWWFETPSGSLWRQCNVLFFHIPIWTVLLIQRSHIIWQTCRPVLAGIRTEWQS